MLRQLYKTLIYNKRRRIDFWILIAFIVTFTVARSIVHFFPGLFLSVHGTHVHHFAYGIVLLAIAGYIGLVHKDRHPNLVAVAFGVGLALAVDEAGMWLHLTSQYYNDTSSDIVVLVLAVLIFLVYFADFFYAVLRTIIQRIVRRG